MCAISKIHQKPDRLHVYHSCTPLLLSPCFSFRYWNCGGWDENTPCEKKNNYNFGIYCYNSTDNLTNTVHSVNVSVFLIYVFPQSDFSLFHVWYFPHLQLLWVPHGQDVEHRVDQKHKTGQDCHRTHCTCLCHSLKCKMEWKNRYRNTISFTFSEYTHRGRMLVRINLLWAHGNEEKEAKEVEQE